MVLMRFIYLFIIFQAKQRTSRKRNIHKISTGDFLNTPYLIPLNWIVCHFKVNFRSTRSAAAAWRPEAPGCLPGLIVVTPHTFVEIANGGSHRIPSKWQCHTHTHRHTSTHTTSHTFTFSSLLSMISETLLALLPTDRHQSTARGVNKSYGSPVWTSTSVCKTNYIHDNSCHYTEWHAFVFWIFTGHRCNQSEPSSDWGPTEVKVVMALYRLDAKGPHRVGQKRTVLYIWTPVYVDRKAFYISNCSVLCPL